MLVDFLKGFSYFLEGITLIRDRSLLRFVWIPLLCNFLLFLILFFLAAFGLNHFSHWVAQFLPQWLQWLYWVVWILSLLFSAITLVFLSTFLVNLVAGPFNSVLSEKVIALLNIEDTANSVSFMQAIPSAISRQLRFITYYLPRACLFLLLFLVPIVQIFAVIFWFLFNGWVFTMQYLDYPMDNHGISLKKMQALMSQKRELCFGFGSAVVLFSMIPLLNFVVVPIAVIGATVLWVKAFREN